MSRSHTSEKEAGSSEEGEVREETMDKPFASTSAPPQTEQNEKGSSKSEPLYIHDDDSDINSSGPPSPADENLPFLSPVIAEGVPPADDAELTETQMHHAKILMLDLLGWGVPPEYILNRGVSHKLVCSVFTDLNLRLPDYIVEDNEAVMNAVTVS